MKNTTRRLTESAIFIAIATVLSMIKIDLPFGGGVTIVSMLPLVVISHRWGWKWGVLTAFVYSLIQLLLGVDNLQYVTGIVMVIGLILLDYVLAFTVIGLSGVMDNLLGKGRKALFLGILVTFTLRFACHLVSGAWIWGEWAEDVFMNISMSGPWMYSFFYNGWYMLGELVMTEVVAMLLYAPLKPFLEGKDIHTRR